jgi:predicted small secreted protein
MGIPRKNPLLVVAVAAVAFAVAGCSTTSGGGSGPSSVGTTPSASSGGFVPASGTADTGQLFPTYTNKEAGYSLDYPGGWRVSEKGSDVRIARFGNAITVVVVPTAKAPYYKGYQTQLETVLAKHDKKLLSKIDKPASLFTVGKDKITKVVIEQVRPTGAPPAPDETVVTYRYLFWKDGKLALVSMSSVKGIDNSAAFDLMASSFRWN